MTLGSAWEYEIGKLRIEIPEENQSLNDSCGEDSCGEDSREDFYCEMCNCISEYPFMTDKICIDCYNDLYEDW